MRVLILGGTGVISRAVTRELLRRGHEPILFTRGQRRAEFAGEVRHVHGDRNDRAGFQAALREVQADVVIDMICFTPEDARLMLDTFAGRVQQIIVCSSSLAYQRPYRSMPVREDDELLCHDPATTFPRAYAKADMERTLRTRIAEGLPITIIRPSFTLGEGSSAFGILRQNYGVVDRIRKGKPVVMSGDGNNPWSYTFAPDLALAFAGAVGNPRTYGQSYHATSEERTLWKDAYLELGRMLDREVHMFHLSSQTLMQAAPALCTHLYWEKSHAGYFDNSKIRRDIPDFQPRINLAQGLRELVAWYEADGAYVDADKDALEDRLYAAHRAMLREVEGAYVG